VIKQNSPTEAKGVWEDLGNWFHRFPRFFPIFFWALDQIKDLKIYAIYAWCHPEVHHPSGTRAWRNPTIEVGSVGSALQVRGG
jgi:hypothetical protein